MTALKLFSPEEFSAPARKRRKKLPGLLRWPDAMRLLDWCAAQVLRASPQKVVAAKKDHLVCWIGLYLGLRVSEICGLEIKDIDLAGQSLFVRQGKGNKDRYLRIPDKLVPVLASWIGTRQEGVLIPGNSAGGKLSDRTIRDRLDRAGRQAGLAVHIHPHLLRHAFSVRFLESGGNIRSLQLLLGHEDLETTAKYLQLDVAKFALDMEKM